MQLSDDMQRTLERSSRSMLRLALTLAVAECVLGQQQDCSVLEAIKEVSPTYASQLTRFLHRIDSTEEEINGGDLARTFFVPNEDIYSQWSANVSADYIYESATAASMQNILLQTLPQAYKVEELIAIATATYHEGDSAETHYSYNTYGDLIPYLGNGSALDVSVYEETEGTNNTYVWGPRNQGNFGCFMGDKCGAIITKADVPACASVIHVIDSPLPPHTFFASVNLIRKPDPSSDAARTYGSEYLYPEVIDCNLHLNESYVRQSAEDPYLYFFLTQGVYGAFENDIGVVDVNDCYTAIVPLADFYDQVYTGECKDEYDVTQIVDSSCKGGPTELCAHQNDPGLFGRRLLGMPKSTREAVAENALLTWVQEQPHASRIPQPATKHTELRGRLLMQAVGSPPSTAAAELTFVEATPANNKCHDAFLDKVKGFDLKQSAIAPPFWFYYGIDSSSPDQNVGFCLVSFEACFSRCLDYTDFNQAFNATDSATCAFAYQNAPDYQY